MEVFQQDVPLLLHLRALVAHALQPDVRRVLLGFLLGLDEFGEHPLCLPRRQQDAYQQPGESRPLAGLGLEEGKGHA